MPQETASTFIGVNVGYQKDAAITDPAEAQKMVSQKLALLKRSGIADSNEYAIYPGLVVYRTEWGCPEAGEPVAGITIDGDVERAIRMGQGLREAFDQSTVTVASYQDGYGDKTIGFIAETKGDLKTIGKAWQQAAEEYYAKTNVYISCGMYQHSDGRVIICAESNPLYKTDPAVWKEAVTTVARSVESTLDTKIDLTFRDAWFNYFRAPERKNSRGQ